MVIIQNNEKSLDRFSNSINALNFLVTSDRDNEDSKTKNNRSTWGRTYYLI